MTPETLLSNALSILGFGTLELVKTPSNRLPVAAELVSELGLLAKTTGWLRETELVPKTQGIARSLKEVKFAMGLLRHGKVPPPVPPHVAKHVGEARALYDLVKL